jgi:hypothetical protein
MTGTCAACLHTSQSRSYLNHLVHVINSARQIEIYTAQPLIPEPSSLRMKLLLHTVKDISCQVPIEFQLTGSKTLQSEIPRFINSVWNMEEFPQH